MVFLILGGFQSPLFSFLNDQSFVVKSGAAQYQDKVLEALNSAIVGEEFAFPTQTGSAYVKVVSAPIYFFDTTETKLIGAGSQEPSDLRFILGRRWKNRFLFQASSWAPFIPWGSETYRAVETKGKTFENSGVEESLEHANQRFHSEIKKFAWGTFPSGVHEKRRFESIKLQIKTESNPYRSSPDPEPLFEVLLEDHQIVVRFDSESRRGFLEPGVFRRKMSEKDHILGPVFDDALEENKVLLVALEKDLDHFASVVRKTVAPPN